jgi:hypothetical protein
MDASQRLAVDESHGDNLGKFAGRVCSLSHGCPTGRVGAKTRAHKMIVGALAWICSGSWPVGAVAAQTSDA